MKNQIEHDTTDMAIEILKEAILRLQGCEHTNIWAGMRGVDCDAISLAIKTIEKI